MKPFSDTDSFISKDGRVEIVFDLDDLSKADIDLVMRSALAGLDSETFDGPDHVTVMITGDERIRELNRDFKGEDQITDVLSFNVENDSVERHEDEDWPEFADSESTNDPIRLGDIAISLPQVIRQAEENGKSPDRELAMLTIHGILHLLGYDHAVPEEEKVMFGKTDVVLAGIFGE